MKPGQRTLSEFLTIWMLKLLRMITAGLSVKKAYKAGKHSSVNERE